MILHLCFSLLELLFSKFSETNLCVALKKQSDSGKGKRRDDGLSAAARKQRDSEIMQQKQKKADEKKEGAK